MKTTTKKVTKLTGKKTKKPVVRKTATWLAKVCYEETAGLYPQKSASADHGRSIYDKSTWDQTSFRDLQMARANIISVAQRNSNVKPTTPGKSTIEQWAWKNMLNAVKLSMQHPLPGNYFFMRQEGVGKQKPSTGAGFGQDEPLASYGPFRNFGNKPVPKGDKAFIDIYDH